MSDEQRKDEEGEVEGHVRSGHMNVEPSEEGEVEGHVRSGHMHEEPSDESDDEVEAHIRKANVRHE